MRHHHSIKNINIGIFSFLVMSFDAVVGFYQAFKELIKIGKLGALTEKWGHRRMVAAPRVARRGIFNTKNEGCGILEMWWIGGITMVF